MLLRQSLSDRGVIWQGSEGRSHGSTSVERGNLLEGRWRWTGRVEAVSFRTHRSKCAVRVLRTRSLHFTRNVIIRSDTRQSLRRERLESGRTIETVHHRVDRLWAERTRTDHVRRVRHLPGAFPVLFLLCGVECGHFGTATAKGMLIEVLIVGLKIGKLEV